MREKYVYKIDLYELRRQLGKNQKDLASILNVTQPDISRREKNMYLSISEYEKLADVFGHDILREHVVDPIQEASLAKRTKKELVTEVKNTRALMDRIHKLEEENERLLSIIEKLTRALEIQACRTLTSSKSHDTDHEIQEQGQ